MFFFLKTHRKRTDFFLLLNGLRSFKPLTCLKEHGPGEVEKQDTLLGAEVR